MAFKMEQRCATWMMQKCTLWKRICARLQRWNAAMWSVSSIAVVRGYGGIRCRWEALATKMTKKTTSSLDNLRMQLRTSSSLTAANPRMEFPPRALSPSNTSATWGRWPNNMSLRMGASSSHCPPPSTFSRILTESVSTQSRQPSQSLLSGPTISTRKKRAKLTISPIPMMMSQVHLFLMKKRKKRKKKMKQ